MKVCATWDTNLLEHRLEEYVLSYPWLLTMVFPLYCRAFVRAKVSGGQAVLGEGRQQFL